MWIFGDFLLCTPAYNNLSHKNVSLKSYNCQSQFFMLYVCFSFLICKVGFEWLFFTNFLSCLSISSNAFFYMIISSLNWIFLYFLGWVQASASEHKMWTYPSVDCCKYISFYLSFKFLHSLCPERLYLLLVGWHSGKGHGNPGGQSSWCKFFDVIYCCNTSPFHLWSSLPVLEYVQFSS